MDFRKESVLCSELVARRDHDGVGGFVVSGVSHIKFEFFNVQSCSGGESCPTSGAGGFQFVSTSEVVAYGESDWVGGHHVQSESDVVQCHFPEADFFFFLSGQSEIARFPSCHIRKCDVPSDGEVCRSHAEAERQVAGQVCSKSVVVGFDLRSNVQECPAG